MVFLIRGYLLYNAVMIFALHQHESAMDIYISINEVYFIW